MLHRTRFTRQVMIAESDAAAYAGSGPWAGAFFSCVPVADKGPAASAIGANCPLARCRHAQICCKAAFFVTHEFGCEKETFLVFLVVPEKASTSRISRRFGGVHVHGRGQSEAEADSAMVETTGLR